MASTPRWAKRKGKISGGGGGGGGGGLAWDGMGWDGIFCVDVREGMGEKAFCFWCVHPNKRFSSIHPSIHPYCIRLKKLAASAHNQHTHTLSLSLTHTHTLSLSLSHTHTHTLPPTHLERRHRRPQVAVPHRQGGAALVLPLAFRLEHHAGEGGVPAAGVRGVDVGVGGDFGVRRGRGACCWWWWC